MAKMKTQGKKFRLPGKKKDTAPPPPPQPIQLTLANAPLWQAKFTEEVRNELRILNQTMKELKGVLANVGTE